MVNNNDTALGRTGVPCEVRYWNRILKKSCCFRRGQRWVNLGRISSYIALSIAHSNTPPLYLLPLKLNFEFELQSVACDHVLL